MDVRAQQTDDDDHVVEGAAARVSLEVGEAVGVALGQLVARTVTDTGVPVR